MMEVGSCERDSGRCARAEGEPKQIHGQGQSGPDSGHHRARQADRLVKADLDQRALRAYNHLGLERRRMLRELRLVWWWWVWADSRSRGIS